jgi:hypothetical protein
MILRNNNLCSSSTQGDLTCSCSDIEAVFMFTGDYCIYAASIWNKVSLCSCFVVTLWILNTERDSEQFTAKCVLHICSLRLVIKSLVHSNESLSSSWILCVFTTLVIITFYNCWLDCIACCTGKLLALGVKWRLEVPERRSTVEVTRGAPSAPPDTTAGELSIRRE